MSVGFDFFIHCYKISAVPQTSSIMSTEFLSFSSSNVALQGGWVGLGWVGLETHNIHTYTLARTSTQAHKHMVCVVVCVYVCACMHVCMCVLCMCDQISV